MTNQPPWPHLLLERGTFLGVQCTIIRHYYTFLGHSERGCGEQPHDKSGSHRSASGPQKPWRLAWRLHERKRALGLSMRARRVGVGGEGSKGSHLSGGRGSKKEALSSRRMRLALARRCFPDVEPKGEGCGCLNLCGGFFRCW